jgi:hypothetical protein
MGFVVPPRHRHPTAGQAVVEYVAAIALVAAVLAAAGTAVGAPGIAQRVVHGIRHGICIVAGDVCAPSEAAAAGLSPCTVLSATRGREGQLELVFVMAASGEAFTVSRDSLGRVTVVKSHLDKAGLQTGAELGLGWFSVGADAGVSVRVVNSRAWQFPDLAHARRFILGLPASANRPSPYLFWRSYEGGPEAEAEVSATLVGHTLTGLATAVDGAAGARIGRDGTVTLYFNTTVDGPEGGVPILPTVGRGKESVLAEYTLGPDGPRTLALHQLVPRDPDQLARVGAEHA